MNKKHKAPVRNMVNPLWDHLHETASRPQVVLVEKLVEKARQILDRVIETFPSYTLHNSIHADNVLNRMADLLGEQVAALNPLETALLILSAHLHDVGMVFSASERESIVKDEPYWSDFLHEHPRAFLEMQNQDRAPLDIVEWYCRWRHAERVFNFLHAIPDADLLWQTFDIREVLGELCLSHSKPVDTVRDSSILVSQLRTDTDLKLLAIILRLADILDFDRSRSPEAVYEYLGISRRSTPRQQASDVEWQKHLCSEGFIFPNKRVRGYTLDFVAGPNNPAVEDDVRHFLATIEDEFRQCASLLPHCSERWRDFALPSRIDRNNIKSNGYRFGQYKFTLDQRQIIDLFAGENLYLDTPFVFLRELLQNAIDTTRHRVVAEQAQGRQNFVPEPISIDHWVDDEGHQWLRIDDYGIGMDEAIVRNFLLRVGSSYYNSPQFQADLLRIGAAANTTIRPISRFGIGVLSCFLEGDCIEINSLRMNADGSRGVPIRLSVHGDQGFYILQTPHLEPSQFPSRNEKASGYRTKFGTSIAVRLSPTKESSVFNLEALLQRWVIAPPVPVLHRGRLIGGDPRKVVDKPWCDKIAVPLSDSQMAEMGRVLGYEVKTPLVVEMIPLDLTKHSTDPSIRGQVLIAAIRENPEWHAMRMKVGFMTGNSIFTQNEFGTTFQLSLSVDTAANQFCIVVNRAIWQPHNNGRDLKAAGDEELLSRGRLGKALKQWKDELVNNTFKERSCVFIPQLSAVVNEDVRCLIASLGSSWDGDRFWSHNGIWFPNKHSDETHYGNTPRMVFDVIERDGQTINHWGLVSLLDDPRPDLSPARDRLRRTPWSIHSVSSFTLCNALRKAGIDERDRDRNKHRAGHTVGWEPRVLGNLLGYVVGKDECLLGNILRDPLLNVNYWGEEPIMNTDRGYQSIKEIQEIVKSGAEVELVDAFRNLDPNEKGHDFLALCAASLIQIGLRYRATLREGEWETKVSLIAINGDPFEVSDGLRLFSPLAFLPLGEDTALRIGGRINSDHRFTRWLVEAAPKMNRHCPGLLAIIRTRLWDRAWDDEKRQKLVEDINGVLRRVSALGLDVQSCEDAILSVKDFPKKSD